MRRAGCPLRSRDLACCLGSSADVAQPRWLARCLMADLKDRSTAALVHDVAELVPRLVRQELDLAQAELTEKGKRAGAGAGLLGGSGVVGWFGVAALVAAAVLGL